MYKKTVFLCDYCGKEFSNIADCKAHEEIHIEDFSKKSSKEISDRLYLLYSFGGMYQTENTVLGMPIDSFRSLMREAAKRVREVEDEHK